MEYEQSRTDPHPLDPTTPDGRDLLISRIIDANAGAGDWRAFRRLAETDASVWRDLADAQRQHERLCEGVGVMTRAADAIELPEPVSDGRVLQRRLDSVGRWGGWAAAAALVLVWSTGVRTGGAPTGNGPDGLQGASLVGGTALRDATPEQAMERYIDAGRSAGVVVGEVPERLIVQTTPREDGSVEVVFLRQIIERRVADQIYREVRDDAGRLVPVAIPAAEIQRLRSY
jgi:hypothetical protein